jgi:putative spermidine/putrescine transport system permease protein
MRRVTLGSATLAAATFAVLLYLVMPTVVVVPLSFNDTSFFQFPPRAWSLRWYRQFFGDVAWLDSLRTSVKLGVVTMVLATVLGTGAALGAVRGRLPGREAFFGLLIAPMVFPTIVFSLALYFVLARLQLLSSFGALIIGHTVLAVPVVFLIVTAALEGMDETIEFAALSSGAPPWRVYLEITLPMIKTSVMTAALFAFLISFDEVVLAMFLSGADSITLPKKMWDGIRLEINPTIAAASSILVGVSVVVVLANVWLRARDGVDRDGDAH